MTAVRPDLRQATATRVLIVDDNVGDAHLAIAALESVRGSRFKIELAESIAEALEILPGVDVVLLDLGLPDSVDLDGLQVLRAAAPDVAVVILTGNDDLPLAEAALLAGAQDYLRKDELDSVTLGRSLRHARSRQAMLVALEASERWASALVHSLSDVVTIHRADGEIVHVGGLGARVVGPAAVLGVRGLRQRVDRPTWRRIVRAFCRWRAGDVRPLEFAVDLDGDERHYECVATNLLDHPLIGGIVVTSRDVTDRHRIQRQLAHEATHDPLTGLGNRTLFNQRLEDALRDQEVHGRPVAVVLIDLDDFKKVNDSFGHPAGDEVLRSIAGLLGVATRDHDSLARIGGDEFVAVCAGVDLEGAQHIAERLQRILVRPFRAEGRDIFLTVSVGIAVASGGTDAATVFRNADLALYEAKRSGKSRVGVFCQALETRAVRRMELETELRGAIARDELAVRYQPVVDLDSGSVVGHEALLRWRHPRLGDVDPEELVAVAEDSDLIGLLGRWVLDQACRQLARWRRSHPHRDHSVAVNVSVRQLGDPAFVTELLEVLDQAGVPARALCLEVTESALIDDSDEVDEALRTLRAAGVRIALDDFGTGYSSLTYLRRLPVDVLKVDRSFTKGMVEQPSDRALVASVLRMAWDLGLDVVAEGVEDPAQRDELRALGCRYAQGFLWSEAVPQDRAEDLLTQTYDVGPPVVVAGALPGPAPTGRPSSVDEVVAVVAHELMQPLTVIRSFAESFDVLRQTEDPAALTGAIARNATSAIELVRLLGDSGALERGTLALNVAVLPLRRTVEGVVDDLRSVLDVEITVGGDGDADVELDEPRFRQIIGNLVANAAKFAPAGTGIQVQVDAGSEASVSVIDSGPGVPADREGELFRRFSKLGRHRGTGLGLYVSRQLARLHGGELTYRRAATGGAHFALVLPLAGSGRLRSSAASSRSAGTETVDGVRPGAGADPDGLAALHRATRSLLSATHPEQVVGASIALVRELGGAVVPASFDAATAIPLDLAMGEGPPLVPVAPPLSVARLRVERLLPAFAEDARDVLQRLRTSADDVVRLDAETGLAAPGDRTPTCRSAVALRLAGQDARSVARLLRATADGADTLLRWDDDVLVVASDAAPERAQRLCEEILDGWLAWGGRDRFEMAVGDAEADGSAVDAAVRALA